MWCYGKTHTKWYQKIRGKFCLENFLEKNIIFVFVLKTEKASSTILSNSCLEKEVTKGTTWWTSQHGFVASKMDTSDWTQF